MIERCKECPHLKENTVYPLSNKKYCNKWFRQTDPEENACEYAYFNLKTKDKQILGKKLFNCTIQEISEMCIKHNSHCKDEEGNFCPLMVVNDPFNECMLMYMVKNPGDWNKFKDKEI